MRQLRAFLVRLAGMFPNARRERDFDSEIGAHLQMHIDDNLRAGMTPGQARRDAILKLGGVQSAKEAYRERSTIPFLENLLQDVRFAIRHLRKNPGFAFTAVLTLGLGICASVAIFAFVDATLIKPLPYRNASRLVGVFASNPQCPRCDISYPDYLDWKKLNSVFTSLEAYQAGGFTLSTPGGAERARGARVGDGFFRTLGVTPALGRDFQTGEDLPAAPRTVILSYSAWQKRFGGNPDVLGQAVTLNGDANVIVGVLPRDFHFAPAGVAEFYTTLHADNPCDVRRSCHNLYAIARLKDEVSLETAFANMSLIAKRLEKQYPDSNRDQGAAVAPLPDVIVGNVRPLLLVLLGGAALLLVIAGVNVTSLLLVRSESRRREVAVRSALGASAARIVRQFVTEGLVLVAAGSALGLASAYWAAQLLARVIPENLMARMPYLHEVGLNFRVLAFAGAISLLAAVLFAITPTLHLSLSKGRQGLVEGSRGSAGTTWRRLGSRLVVLELTTAMVLLVGAGLLGKSLYLLLQEDIGLQPEGLATLRVAPPDGGYSKNEQIIALARRILNRLEGLPGVKSAALSSTPPVAGGNTMWIKVVGRPYHGEHNDVNYREVSSGYFTTLQARLLRGRYFTEEDDASKPPVIIINRALAKQYFSGEDAIGRQLLYTSSSSQPMEIVGIVDDIKEGPLDTATRPTMYVAFNQDPTNGFSIFVRTSQSERSLLPTITAVIREIDPAISTFEGATMNDRINDSPAAYLRRSSACLVGCFALAALLLGVVGLYGVTAYSVSQRTREIGVRMALGAQSGSVYRLILREAGWLVSLGIGIGIVCAMAAATLLRGLLYGVGSWDMPTLAAVSAVLGMSALLASYFPARRAASVNPVEALRSE